MDFFAKTPDEIITGSYWKYVESGHHYRETGDFQYYIQDRTADDIERGRHRIVSDYDDYVHRFSATEILRWFIPYDKELRPNVVKLGGILTRMKLQGIPFEELQELLVKLEV